MSWDDENLTGSMGNDDAVLMDSWDVEDEPIMDSWDTPEETPKEEVKPIPAKKDDKKKNNKKEDNIMNHLEQLDPKLKKELLKKAELEADLKNASDLFGDLSMAEEHPRARALAKEQDLLSQIPIITKETPIENHPLFKDAETKKDYQDLRKAVGTAIVSMNEKSSLNYSSALAIDLIRDVSKPLSIESIRQTVATLNVLIKDKEKAERQARLAKVRGGTATGGAGKKKAKGTKTNLGGAFKKDQEFDLDNVDYDDFGDDDFM